METKEDIGINEGKQHDCCKHKSKSSNLKNYVLFGMIAIVLLISIVQSFQIKALKAGFTGNVVKGNGLDMSGWTEDEKMQYEHHGTLPAGSQSSKQASQVGSC
ncbi:hypothetical protein HYX03_00030 [Candidatus Woesearchaeota archaeon]|nr:hypothetical protein [Candidatus Woesearchaeota archaeon]